MFYRNRKPYVYFDYSLSYKYFKSLLLNGKQAYNGLSALITQEKLSKHFAIKAHLLHKVHCTFSYYSFLLCMKTHCTSKRVTNSWLAIQAQFRSFGAGLLPDTVATVAFLTYQY